MKRKLRSYNNIFITGMPGCGKSTFGRIYAYLFKRNFIDFDNFLEKTLNTTIVKIFNTKGIDGFRKEESNILASLVKHNNTVISLGGGTLLNSENYHFLQNYGVIVSLVGLPDEIIAQRIFKDQQNTTQRKRPLFMPCQNQEQILQKVKEISQKRSGVYMRADLLLNQFTNSTDNLVLSLRRAELKDFYLRQ